ncbi:uncharacterized protein [Manis javanica]|uniref:uncharacterized protein isoform X2 n=1 Tax=Manis javanica TaxID=9974 RepID=UPI003C6D8C51
MLTNLTASGKMESRPKKRRTACCRRRLRLHRLSLHRRCSRVHRRCPRQSSLKAFTRRKGTGKGAALRERPLTAPRARAPAPHRRLAPPRGALASLAPTSRAACLQFYLDLIHDRPSVLQTTVTLTATRCHPELRAGAPTLSLQHPLVSYSQHVILSSLFAISMAVCKGALGGIIIDVSGGAASAKKSKYLDLKTVCCANHAHPHCLSLSGEQVPALHG